MPRRHAHPWLLACGALALAGALTAAGRAQDELELQFIGNAAFRITDGQTTLLTDFPYKSGAFGSMEYRMEDVGPIADGVSLVTHDHADHWDAALFRKTTLKVIAPPAITKGLPVDRILPWGDRIAYKDIEVHPIATSHAPTHVSYLVVWHGVRMFFTGDTEDPQPVLAQARLDALFATPWLIQSLAKSGRKIDTELLVVHHHKAGEDVPLLPRMMLPRQGDVFRIDYR